MSSSSRLSCTKCTCVKHYCMVCERIWGVSGLRKCEAYPDCGARMDGSLVAYTIINDLCHQHREAQASSSAQSGLRPVETQQAQVPPLRRRQTVAEMAATLPYRPQYRRPHRRPQSPPSMDIGRPAVSPTPASPEQRVRPEMIQRTRHSNEEAGSSQAISIPRFATSPRLQPSVLPSSPLSTSPPPDLALSMEQARRLREKFTPPSSSPPRGGVFYDEAVMAKIQERLEASKPKPAELSDNPEELVSVWYRSPTFKERIGKVISRMKSSSSLGSDNSPEESPKRTRKDGKGKGKGKRSDDEEGDGKGEGRGKKV